MELSLPTYVCGDKIVAFSAVVNDPPSAAPLPLSTQHGLKSPLGEIQANGNCGGDIDISNASYSANASSDCTPMVPPCSMLLGGGRGVTRRISAEPPSSSSNNADSADLPSDELSALLMSMKQSSAACVDPTILPPLPAPFQEEDYQERSEKRTSRGRVSRPTSKSDDNIQYDEYEGRMLQYSESRKRSGVALIPPVDSEGEEEGDFALKKAKHGCTIKGCTFTGSKSVVATHIKNHVAQSMQLTPSNLAALTVKKEKKSTREKGPRAAVYKNYEPDLEFDERDEAKAADEGTVTTKKRSLSDVGSRPYGCYYDGCVARFARPDSLKRHIAVHTGTKPFKCEVADCSYASNQKCNLVTHLRKVHVASENGYHRAQVKLNVNGEYDAHSMNANMDMEGDDVEYRYTHSTKKVTPEGKRGSEGKSRKSSIALDYDEESPDSMRKPLRKRVRSSSKEGDAVIIKEFDRVEVRSRSGGGDWRAAIVLRVRDDFTYFVKFDDGARESNILASHIRLLPIAGESSSIEISSGGADFPSSVDTSGNNTHDSYSSVSNADYDLSVQQDDVEIGKLFEALLVQEDSGLSEAPTTGDKQQSPEWRVCKIISVVEAGKAYQVDWMPESIMTNGKGSTVTISNLRKIPSDPLSLSLSLSIASPQSTIVDTGVALTLLN